MLEEIDLVPYIIIGIGTLIVFGYIAKSCFDFIVIIALQICIYCLRLIEWILNGFFPTFVILGFIYAYTLSNFIPALFMPWMIISGIIYDIIKERFPDRDNGMLKFSITIVKSILASLIIIYLFISLKLDFVQSIIIGLFISIIWGYKIVKKEEEHAQRLYKCLTKDF